MMLYDAIEVNMIIQVKKSNDEIAIFVDGQQVYHLDIVDDYYSEDYWNSKEEDYDLQSK